MEARQGDLPPTKQLSFATREMNQAKIAYK